MINFQQVSAVGKTLAFYEGDSGRVIAAVWLLNRVQILGSGAAHTGLPPIIDAVPIDEW